MNKNSFLNNNWLLIGAIYLLAVIVRLLIVIFFANNQGPIYENYLIAEFIVSGHGYWWDWMGDIPAQPTALLPPIYTYFIVPVIKIFNNPIYMLYIIQVFFNALIVIPAFYLGKHLSGTRIAGAVLAAIFAVFPEIAIEPIRMASEVLFIPCVVLVIWLYLRWKQLFIINTSYVNFFWLGLIIGIATLIKTTGSLIVLGFFISLVFEKKNRIKFIKAAILMGIGFFLAISPWLIRNYIVFHEPMMIASNYGYNLWRGCHPWGSGTEYLDDGRQSESELSPEYREYLEKYRPKQEIEMDKFYFNEAIKFIKQDPKHYISHILKRAFYFVTIDITHPLTKNVFYIGGYISALFFGIWGWIILKRKRVLDSAFWLVPLIVFCFYMPVVNVPRFRLIPMVILLALSAVSITELINKRWPQLAENLS